MVTVDPGLPTEMGFEVTSQARFEGTGLEFLLDPGAQRVQRLPTQGREVNRLIQCSVLWVVVNGSGVETFGELLELFATPTGFGRLGLLLSARRGPGLLLGTLFPGACHGRLGDGLNGLAVEVDALMAGDDRFEIRRRPGIPGEGLTD